jgi:hypothetical protein
MKKLFLLLELVCILVTCTVSGSLYLKGEYNMSAMLTLTWVISLGVWIKSNGLLENKKTAQATNTQETF